MAFRHFEREVMTTDEVKSIEAVADSMEVCLRVILERNLYRDALKMLADYDHIATRHAAQSALRRGAAIMEEAINPVEPWNGESQ